MSRVQRHGGDLSARSCSFSFKRWIPGLFDRETPTERHMNNHRSPLSLGFPPMLHEQMGPVKPRLMGNSSAFTANKLDTQEHSDMGPTHEECSAEASLVFRTGVYLSRVRRVSSIIHFRHKHCVDIS